MELGSVDYLTKLSETSSRHTASLIDATTPKDAMQEGQAPSPIPSRSGPLSDNRPGASMGEAHHQWTSSPRAHGRSKESNKKSTKDKDSRYYEDRRHR